MSTSRLATAIPLFSGGGVLLLFGQVMLFSRPYHQRYSAFLLAGLGLALVLLGVWSAQKGTPRWLRYILERAAFCLGITEWQVLCLGLAVPMTAVVPLTAGELGSMFNPSIAVTAWALVLGLAVAGGWMSVAPLRRPSMHLVALFLILTTGAFLLRGAWTDRVPIFLTGDEGSAGLFAVSLARGEFNNLFISGWYSFPAFYFAIPALSIRLFGQTAEALRLPAALVGALTVTATFFVVRAMFGRRVAWFSSLFLAALHFHIHFSRIGLNNIWDGLWYTVFLGALWYGWEYHRRNAYLLAGLALGLGQYFYPSTRALFGLLVVWVILAAILDRPRLQREGVNLLFLFLLSLLVAWPLFWHYLQQPEAFVAPLNRVGLSREWLAYEAQISGRPIWGVLLRQLWLGFGAFTYEPLRAWYGPGYAILRPWPAAFFLIGLILLCLRAERWRALLLLLWLATFGLIGALSESTPAAQRYIAAAPVCAVLVGYGLSESAALLSAAWAKGRRWFSALAVLLALFLALDDLYFYFLTYTPRSVLEQARSHTMIAQRLAEELRSYPADTQVVFFGYPAMGFRSIPSLQYLAPGIEGVDITAPWSSESKEQISAEHLLFVFLPHLGGEIQAVQADYPGGLLRREIAADGETLYWLYQVPAP